MTSSAHTSTQAELQATTVKQAAEIQLLKAENDWLRGQFNLAQHKLYGQSSERTSLDPAPLQNDLLFNEAEALVAPDVPEPTIEEATQRRRKTRGKREIQLAALPIEEVRYKLPLEEQVCGHCSGALHEMGSEVRREIKIIPAQAFVVQHIQVKYACRHCALHVVSRPPIIAPMPKPAFSNSPASPSSVAYVMNQKYELGLPLYRLEQDLQDVGLELSRQTMANWVIRGAGLLEPLYDRLHEKLVARDILHADETVLQVLHEMGRAPTTESRMWVYHTGREMPDGRAGPPIVLYQYTTTRGAQHPREFLKGFSGFLHVDGFIGYDDLPDTTLVGCWAHARRKFNDALKNLPPASRAAKSASTSASTSAGTETGTPCASRIGLNYCNSLFKIESELRDCTPAERQARRQRESVPLTEKFHAWLEKTSPHTLAKSPLGKAIFYCRAQWPKLLAFLEDGRLELDNNRCERAVKPFVIGRKNWLFANTPRGAKASAIAYSIVETARENGLRPFDYLTMLFERLPNLDPADGLEALLPWSEEVQTRCGSTAKNTP